MELLKLCTALRALLEELFSACFESLCQPCPGLTWALPCAQGSPATMITCIWHPWADCWDFEFLKSVRVHWGFSFLSFFIFSPFFSHIQCELQGSFQVFLHFVSIGKRLSKILSFLNLLILFYLSKFINFISHFSTINCLHVLQCSFSPNPDQIFFRTKAKRRNKF